MEKSQVKSLRWQTSNTIRTWLPRLQSHRGYWVGGIRENTLAAIEKAAELKYQMVEFDVRLTKDRRVVLFHDGVIQGHVLANMTYAEILKIEPINTLDEVCLWLSNYSDKTFKFNIELKTSAIVGGELENQVAKVVQKFALEHQVLISSFNPLALGRMRMLNGNLFRALLLTLEEHPKNRWYFRYMTFNFFAKPHVLNLRVDDWSEQKFKKISRLVPVVLWTYNDTDMGAEAKTRKEIGAKLYSEWIHGVISDEITPERLKD